MRKIVLAGVLVLLICFSVRPVFAESKIGVGVDFLKSEGEDRSTVDYRSDFKDTDAGVRLYYEHLLKELLGVQLELGYYKYESSDKTSYDPDSHEYSFDDYYKVDFASLFKYYFHIKGDISLYLAGGLGIEYKKYETKYEDKDYDYSEVFQSTMNQETINLVEQVGIGIQFPLFKRFSIFIEDRFKNKISDGQLRVGFYLIPSKNNAKRDEKEKLNGRLR
ncbi:MAG: outer membrane beta-barrel protein [bacterium]